MSKVKFQLRNGVTLRVSKAGARGLSRAGGQYRRKDMHAEDNNTKKIIGLQGLTVAQLRDLAESRNIKIPAGALKTEIIELLE